MSDDDLLLVTAGKTSQLLILSGYLDTEVIDVLLCQFLFLFCIQENLSHERFTQDSACDVICNR